MNLENILPLVQRPVRYINHEWNSYKGKENAEVNVCLCFPDLYELGASNLGIEILYHIVNRLDYAKAERCYSPDEDLEKLLTENKLPLFSLETKTPLKNFDIVGITLAYELCATNVLNILKLASIPLFSKDRDETCPLIIGGGPLTANPEPLADFFDAFVVGDGEEAICDIINAVKRKTGSGKRRKELLLELAKIPGVYVPQFYDVEYNSDNTIKQIKPNISGVPEKITKRTVKLDDVYFPSNQIVPFMETVHCRLNIEIGRGCAQKCRFCQATKYYYPYRIRSKENILKYVEDGLKSTGYEDVSLSSLSCTDYRGLEVLLAEINKKHGNDRISISLPSLRCDQFSLKIAGDLQKAKRTNLTFAPEAGSERLRNVLGKNLTNNQIQSTLKLANSMGWKQIKLYFMIGLPTETEEDIEAINTLVRTIKNSAKNLNFNITVSSFVPKAQTAFQWSKMEDAQTLQDRLKKLIKILPASVKYSHMENSILEGIFARGDRRLSNVILKAFEKGCKFDQWREKLKFSLWLDTFKEENVDINFYLSRERKENEVLPWDHILLAADKDLLLKEYKNALSVQENVSEHVSEVPADSVPNIQAPYDQLRAPVQKMRMCFSRSSEVRFVSHLEQIEVLRRAVRRAGLPVVYTQGFHPQPKMAFGPAVSVGHESSSEYMEIELFSKVTLNDFQNRLQQTLPEGFKVLSVKQIPVFFPSIESLVNVASYMAQIKAEQSSIDDFLKKPEIIIEKIKNNVVKRIDVKPLIIKIENTDNGLLLQLRFGPQRTVKPEKVIGLLCGLSENEIKCLRINRVQVLSEKKDRTLSAV